MKATNIIDQLTSGASYNNQNGILSVDKDTDMKEYLPQFFGEHIESIYDPNDIFHLKVYDDGERNFFYMYNERFATSLDKQIFAILYADETDIIYIYEIE